MIIKSDFKDYYDYVTTWGINPDCYYIRKYKHECVNDSLGIIVDNFSFSEPIRCTFYGYVLCFCGQTYPFLKSRNTYIYDYEGFSNYIQIPKSENYTLSRLKRFFEINYRFNCLEINENINLRLS